MNVLQPAFLRACHKSKIEVININFRYDRAKYPFLGFCHPELVEGLQKSKKDMGDSGGFDKPSVSNKKPTFKYKTNFKVCLKPQLLQTAVSGWFL